MRLASLLEQVLRREGAALRASLLRAGADLTEAEDALQEASLRALHSWPRDGLPQRPAGWLHTVAHRCWLDQRRRRREDPLDAASSDRLVDPAPDPGQWLEQEQARASAVDDDRLCLLFQICHPALAVESSMALALKLVGGLSTREVARAFLLSDAGAAQRLLRARQKIRQAGIPFALPQAADLPQRQAAVLRVIYLIFNEGHAATEAEGLLRPDLCREALRLAQLMVTLLPGHAEALGLLALLYLTDARRPARLSAEGELLTLQMQDRSRWDGEQIRRGQAALQQGMACLARKFHEPSTAAADLAAVAPDRTDTHRPGPYLLQAAIAALHAEATSSATTDWRQILLLYRRLLQVEPGPVTELNAAIALAMSAGPAAGLAWLDRLQAQGLLDGYALLPASRAALLSQLGQAEAAVRAYDEALMQVRNPTERRFLLRRREALQAPSAAN